MINVYTVKWGTKYGPEYVNMILDQCQRLITKDIKFYCLTEDPTGLNDEVIPLALPKNNPYEKWWNKLYLFDREIVSQSGEKIFFDLDIIMQHRVDPFVEHDCGDKLTFIRTHWHNLQLMRMDTKENPRAYTDLNSSVLRWNDSLDVDKITKFVRDNHDQMMFYYRGIDNLFGDQRERLAKLDFFPDGWVYSYNYGYMWPEDTQERVYRDAPLIRLYDSMGRPEDVKF